MLQFDASHTLSLSSAKVWWERSAPSQTAEIGRDCCSHKSYQTVSDGLAVALHGASMLREPVFMSQLWKKITLSSLSGEWFFAHACVRVRACACVCVNASVQAGRDEVQISSSAAVAEGEGVAITRGKDTLETHLIWPMNQLQVNKRRT